VRQVVHHLPDSHLNGYTRFHLALTESSPTIKPYDEAGWARLPDARGPVDLSLDLLEALHRRWVFLLEQLRADDWARVYRHPGQGRDFTLDEALALYAWHGGTTPRTSPPCAPQGMDRADSGPPAGDRRPRVEICAGGVRTRAPRRGQLAAFMEVVDQRVAPLGSP
jgi:hypothetical protein